MNIVHRKPQLDVTRIAIETNCYDIWGWVAYDRNSYDGAPDAALSARLIGTGETEQQAIADLMKQIEELDE